MEEFTILYFMKLHKLRKTSELKLIEFMVSLKYYYTKNWDRAKTFATLLGVYRKGDNIEADAKIHSSDIYLQDYFFYVYSQAYKNRSLIHEPEEGHSYVSFETEEQLTKSTLKWAVEAESKKFANKVKRLYKKGKDPHGLDIDYIDLD
jgi:hypothetical protein